MMIRSAISLTMFCILTSSPAIVAAQSARPASLPAVAREMDQDPMAAPPAYGEKSAPLAIPPGLGQTLPEATAGADEKAGAQNRLEFSFRRPDGLHFTPLTREVKEKVASPPSMRIPPIRPFTAKSENK